MFPRRLTRYVWGEVTYFSLGGLFFWTFVLLMNTLFFVAEKAITMGLGWELTLRLLAYEIPKLLVMSIPVGVLFGTMMAVGRLSGDQEWVALQSVGLGLGGLLRPVALHGLVAFGVSFGIYAFVFPASNFGARSMQPDIVFSRNMAANLKPRVFYTDLPGVALFVSNIRPSTAEEGRLEGVVLHQAEGASGFEELTLARLGDLYPSPDGSGALQIELIEGMQYQFRSDAPDDYRQADFVRLFPPRLDPPAYLSAFRGPPTKTRLDMTVPELIEDHREAETLSDPVMRELRLRGTRMELHKRFALPVTCLLFAILAVPLGVTRARSGKGAAFTLSIVVIIVYWIIFTTTQDHASAGGIPPFAGVWAANGVILLWILIAFWRLRRTGGQSSGAVLSWLVAPAVAVGGFFRASPAEADPAAGDGEPADTPEPELPPRRVGSARLVSLVDRHVLTGFLRILFIALLSTYAVYGIAEIKDLVDGLVKNKQPLSAVGEFFIYFTPGMVTLVLPISCLVAAVLAFTMMARSGELTAMMASGLNLRRMTIPVLGVTLLFCAFYFLIQDRVAPRTNQRASEIKDQILGRRPRSYGAAIGGRWTIGDEGRLYHYRTYDPEKEVFQGLHVFTVNRDELRIIDHLYTTTARWTGSEWKLGKGWQREFTTGAMLKGEVEVETFEEGHEEGLDPPDNFERRERSLTASATSMADQMSVKEIRTQIDSLRDSGYDATRLQVAYYAKFAQPATPLVMVILGLPFAFRVGRRGSLYGIGVALGLVVVYWSVFAVFRALGFETILPPLLAAWAPNVLFTLLGLYLMLYIRT
jgi:LPS export ABC transporter permease LptG/LPS export ABC transporter permease LptF